MGFLQDTPVAQRGVDHRMQAPLCELVLAQVDAAVTRALDLAADFGHFVAFVQRSVAVDRLGQILRTSCAS